MTGIQVHPTVQDDARQSQYFSTDCHIVSDSPFALHEYLMVPIRDTGFLTMTQLQYKKKMSRGRVVIEDVCALLKRKFRRLKYIAANVHQFPLIIKACCDLHNMALSDTEEVARLEEHWLHNTQANGWNNAPVEEVWVGF